MKSEMSEVIKFQIYELYSTNIFYECIFQNETIKFFANNSSIYNSVLNEITLFLFTSYTSKNISLLRKKKIHNFLIRICVLCIDRLFHPTIVITKNIFNYSF